MVRLFISSRRRRLKRPGVERHTHAAAAAAAAVPEDQRRAADVATPCRGVDCGRSWRRVQLCCGLGTECELEVYCLRQFHALEPDLRTGIEPQVSGEAVWSHATRPTGLLPRDVNPEARLRCWDIVKALGSVTPSTRPLVVWPHSLSH
jgi:hypothetical protein